MPLSEWMVVGRLGGVGWVADGRKTNRRKTMMTPRRRKRRGRRGRRGVGRGREGKQDHSIVMS